MPRRPSPVVVLLVGLALGAGACGTPAAGPSAGPAHQGPGEEAGDVALLVEAVATTTDLRRAVGAAQRRHGRLEERLAPVRSLHATQRDTLVEALPEDSADADGSSGRALPDTPSPAKALRVLMRREQQAGRALTDLAVEAESGRFARVLASMAASTAQVRLVLAPGSGRPGGGPDDEPGGPGTAGAATTGGDTTGPSAEGEVEAAQAALAAEHAAVWSYGVLGARTSATESPGTFVEVEAAYEAHRARRDGLTEHLREAGADPVTASPTYRLPREVSSPDVVRRLARRLERTSAGWWSALVATSVGPTRRDAAAALADAAQREVDLGGSPQPFPGAPELE